MGAGGAEGGGEAGVRGARGWHKADTRGLIRLRFLEPVCGPRAWLLVGRAVFDSYPKMRHQNFPEGNLPKLDLAGSNPVFRSMFQ